jgi:hypothetical protein
LENSGREARAVRVPKRFVVRKSSAGRDNLNRRFLSNKKVPLGFIIKPSVSEPRVALKGAI